MNPSLLDILRCPASGERLDLHSFQTAQGPGGETDVVEGLLVSRTTQRPYAVLNGVPIMFDDGLPREFYERHAAEIAAHVQTTQLGTKDEPRWSFSDQWGTDADLGLERTWGHTTESRLEQLLLEADRPREWFRGRRMLDAGCGNGRLTDAMTALGAEAVGIDFSNSVFLAHARRRSPNVHYVRGDLQRPPFAPETFDLVFSTGVLHHTPNTEHTFSKVARTVKADGSFYMWLYSLPEGFARRYLWYGAHDTIRRVVSRLPAGMARGVARLGAHVARAKYRITGRRDDQTVDEMVIGLLDTMTPRWRHYHTPTEVARWFFEAGFGPPTVTNWDNAYGFGAVATKRSPYATPGPRFDERRRRIEETLSPTA